MGTRRQRPRSNFVLCGKHTFPTEDAARSVMLTVLREQPHERIDHTANVYFCKPCDGWHWGRRNPRRFNLTKVATP
jgi:hypothetical protein